MSQQLQRFLGSGDALARLHDHAARLRRLQGLLECHLPPSMAGACAVANLKNDTLVLLAQGGAVAAKLKQLAPTLLTQLGAAGVPLKAIQVKVQVHIAAPAAPPPTARILSGTGRESIEALSATLPVDSPLRQSLERLVARSRGA
jgi:hypothetical protein